MIEIVLMYYLSTVKAKSQRVCNNLKKISISKISKIWLRGGHKIPNISQIQIQITSSLDRVSVLTYFLSLNWSWSQHPVYVPTSMSLSLNIHKTFLS